MTGNSHRIVFEQVHFCNVERFFTWGFKASLFSLFWGFNKLKQLGKFAVHVEKKPWPIFSEINNIRVKIKLLLATYFAAFAVFFKMS